MSARATTDPLAGLAEAAFQEQVVEYARLSGWLVYHTFDSRHSAPGFPDLTMIRITPRGRRELVFAELKSRTGKVSAAQQQWVDALSQVEADSEFARNVAGDGSAQAFVEVYVWRPADWPAIEQRLRRSR